MGRPQQKTSADKMIKRLEERFPGLRGCVVQVNPSDSERMDRFDDSLNHFDFKTQKSLRCQHCAEVFSKKSTVAMIRHKQQNRCHVCKRKLMCKTELDKHLWKKHRLGERPKKQVQQTQPEEVPDGDTENSRDTESDENTRRPPPPQHTVSFLKFKEQIRMKIKLTTPAAEVRPEAKKRKSTECTDCSITIQRSSKLRRHSEPKLCHFCGDRFHCKTLFKAHISKEEMFKVAQMRQIESSPEPGCSQPEAGCPESGPACPGVEPSCPELGPGCPKTDPGCPELESRYPDPVSGHPEPQPGCPELVSRYPEQFPDLVPGHPEPQPGCPELVPGYPEQRPEPESRCPDPAPCHPGCPELMPGYPEQRPELDGPPDLCSWSTICEREDRESLRSPSPPPPPKYFRCPSCGLECPGETSLLSHLTKGSCVVCGEHLMCTVDVLVHGKTCVVRPSYRQGLLCDGGGRLLEMLQSVADRMDNALSLHTSRIMMDSMVGNLPLMAPAIESSSGREIESSEPSGNVTIVDSVTISLGDYENDELRSSEIKAEVDA